MKHERMKILDLLEQGKITAEEATHLLEAIKRPGSESGTFAFDEETTQNLEEKVNRFAKGVDNLAREFGNRMETAYKDFEPKLKKASQTVLERTASLFDEISKSLNESLENARRVNEETVCEEDACDEACEKNTCEENTDCATDDVPREN